MDLSYWEHKAWLSNVDFAIIGSGIVGLSCALRLKTKFPKANILVLEQGILPNGGSTKNAGFACFGSLSEIIDDLHTHTEEEVVQLIRKRWNGLELLRKNLGDHAIDFQANHGFELFNNQDLELYEDCISKKDKINTLLKPIFKNAVFTTQHNSFNFENIIPKYIVNTFEGQIDTGKMMQALLYKVRQSGIRILNNCTVTYYYFRNIDNRILLGGGRHLDFTTEETIQFGLTQTVQQKLEELLHTTIVPNTNVEIEHRWSGIMGVGLQKKPIVKPISNNVFCGVRLGGMGVAIGSIIGTELADLL